MDHKNISSVNDQPFPKQGVGLAHTDTGKTGSRHLNLPSCPTTNHAGGCFCGNIRYLINGEPVIHLYCFCEECHSMTGADGYHSGCMVKESDFQLVSGTPATHEERSKEGRTVKRHYCRKCGCELWAQTDLGLISVSTSTFDDPTACHSTKKVFVHDAPDWARLPDKSAQRHSPSSKDSPDVEDDTDSEFTTADLMLEPGSHSQVVRDDEDDTDLDYESVDLELEQEPLNKDIRDDEDDTDLDYERIDVDDRHGHGNFGYTPRQPSCRQKP